MLSAKDICLLGSLRTLEKAGVDSLKIEGRLRSPEYVGTVTLAYAAALRGKDPDRTAVRTVFNRGEYSEAYVSSDRPDIIYPKTQNNIGSFAATVAAVRGRILSSKARSAPVTETGSKYCAAAGRRAELSAVTENMRRRGRKTRRRTSADAKRGNKRKYRAPYKPLIMLA